MDARQTRIKNIRQKTHAIGCERYGNGLHYTSVPIYQFNSSGLDKMPIYFQMRFREWKYSVFVIKISLKYDPKSPIDNKPAMVWIMGWRGIGEKPLSHPMLIRFTDAYMRHYGGMS